MRHHLTSIIVSVGYDDFLSVTLPINKQHCDGLTVITSPEDLATKAICAQHCVDILETNAFYDDGAAFNKGKAINGALKTIENDDDWIMFLDADIVLPSNFRDLLDTAALQPDCLYTCDRYICDSFHLWTQIASGGREYFHGQLYDARKFLYIPKWDQITKGLNLPVGYLQIAHRHSALRSGYPEQFPNANWSDVEFTRRFPGENRVWLPGISVLHLGAPGGNEDGRKGAADSRWTA